MMMVMVDGDYGEYDHQGHDTVMTCVKECLTLFTCSPMVYPAVPNRSILSGQICVLLFVSVCIFLCVRFFMCVRESCTLDNVAA